MRKIEELSADDREYYDIFEPLIREHTAADHHFIMKTWLRVIAYDFSRTRKERFYIKQQELIRNVMKNPNARCAILCDADHRDYIVGFIVGEDAPVAAKKPLIIHFVFVRQSYRHQGLCKQLLSALSWYPGRKVLVTQWSRDLYALNQHFNMEYDPFILQGIRNPLEENEDGDQLPAQ